MSGVVEKWTEIAYSTEPVNRSAAAEAVNALYKTALGREPREIIWCQSPARAIRVVADGEGGTYFGPSVREQLRTQPWHRARTELMEQMGREAWTSLWQETCGEIAPTVAGLTEQIAIAVASQGKTVEERTRLRLALTFADHGQFDAAWLPLFDGRWSELSDGPTLEALAAVAEQAHWWWPFGNVAVVCERPTQLHLDERGRLHYGDGPALEYGDGFLLNRWHGVTIPPEFAQTLRSLTPAVIREERNAELRRIMLEHYGHDRYIADSGAEPVHQDEAGKLWRIQLGNDEPVTLVEVVNATAEPDGTFRTYWLRVPPNTRTPAEGVAWTFGLTGEEYKPLIQT